MERKSLVIWEGAGTTTYPETNKEAGDTPFELDAVLLYSYLYPNPVHALMFSMIEFHSGVLLGISPRQELS